MTVNPVFKGHSHERTPCDQGTLSQNVSYLGHAKDPATKHGDTSSGILRCPLKTGFHALCCGLTRQVSYLKPMLVRLLYM